MSETGPYTVIPIHLDALYLEKETGSAGARVDFSRLPYSDGQEDVNEATPYLGEEIQAIPFHANRQGLEKGVHLHWAFPAALTRAHKTDPSQKPEFPAVPNRWLISRYRGATAKPDKQWLVESDFLHPVAPGDTQNSTVYPNPGSGDPALPFRHLGRARALVDGKLPETSKDNEFLPDPLTAIGYGEPTFAAFYPNCRGVFGFFDPLLDKKKTEKDSATGADKTTYSFQPLDKPESIRYDIVGIYRRPEQDFLSRYTQALLDKFRSQINTTTQLDDLIGWVTQTLKEELGLDLELAAESTQGAGTLLTQYQETLGQQGTPPSSDSAFASFCDSFLKAFVPSVTLFGSIEAEHVAATPPQVSSLAVGNTGPEALSAWLGREMGDGAADRARQIEEFLESVQLSAQLDHLEVDTVARFLELRHAKGFASVAGGLRWRIRPVSDDSQPADSPTASVSVPLVTPEIATDLHQLNQLQLAYDRLTWRIESKRKQLYANWTKYMVSQYPPAASDTEYPDVDELRFFIEQGDLAAIEDLNRQQTQLEAQRQAQLSQLETKLFQEQKIGEADITDWAGFTKDFERNFPEQHAKLPSGWTPEQQARIIERLNDLLDVGGIFSNRPKEQFHANRPAYDHPLRVADFPDWAELLSGLSALKGFVTTDWPAKTAADSVEERTAILAQLDTILHQAGVVIQTFPTDYGGKRAKYIQPLELHELKGSWTELLAATQALQQEVAASLPDFDSELIRTAMITQLNNLLEQGMDPTGASPLLTPANPDHPELQTISAKEELSPGEHLRYNRLVLEQLFPALRRRPAYVLQQEGHDRFRQPADPVVLLAGTGLPASPRHEQEDTLKCPVLTGARDLLECYSSILEELATYQEAKGIWAEYTFIGQQQSERPAYHPLLLDWQVDYYPSEFQLGTDFQKSGYPPDYLDQNFQLNAQEVDLTYSGTSHAAGAHSYTGSTVLSAYASPLLVRMLAGYIKTEQVRNDFSGSYYTQVSVPDSAKKASQVSLQKWHKEPGDAVKKGDRLATLAIDTTELDVLSPEAGRLLTICKDPASPVNSDDTLATILRAGSTVKDANTILGETEISHEELAVAVFRKLFPDSGPPPAGPISYLSQSIGGFHRALLMHKQGYQLPIEDPLGFPEYQTFTQEVGRVVGALNHAMVLPQNAFFPIRTGGMNISDLRLIDTFGREMYRLRGGKDPKEVTASAPLSPLAASDFQLQLPPRFVQPARLDFRWLSAQGEDLEMNDHPAASPICGWVLLNELDRSLLVYDPAGQALGYVDRERRWRVFPGQAGPVLPVGIDNPYLRRLANWLTGPDGPEWDSFFDRLNSGLDNIETDHSDQHQGIALLMSQPLALVRATVQLELQGDPAQHQGWEHLEQNLRAFIGNGTVQPTTLGFEQVRVPLRFGEDHRLNDGLVAFWVENEAGTAYRDNRCYMPLDDQRELTLRAAGSADLTGAGLTFSMLLDPTGALHLTTGVLPVATLQIPHEQFTAAIAAIEVAFLTAPLLTQRGLINASLPKEAGYAWSWVEENQDGWRELSTVGHLTPAELQRAFGENSQSIWQKLRDNGYLSVDATTGEALITIGSAKQQLADIDGLKDLAPKLQLFLNGHQIQPFQTSAALNGPQEVREGWLKLRPVQPPATNNKN